MTPDIALQIIRNKAGESSPALFWLVKKCLAEFAPAGTKEIKYIFPGDMRVGKNTYQSASVRVVRFQRTMSARGGLHPVVEKAQRSFFDSFK